MHPLESVEGNNCLPNSAGYVRATFWSTCQWITGDYRMLAEQRSGVVVVVADAGVAGAVREDAARIARFEGIAATARAKERDSARTEAR